MRRTVVQLALVVGTALLAPASSRAGPVATLDSDSIGFGVFGEGERNELEAVFTLRNTGDEKLRVVEVRPSCGCTVVDYDKTIGPGEAGTIRPAVDIRGMTGHIRKSVRVVTNADSGRELRLVITATVRPLIDVSPRFVSLSRTGDDRRTVLTLSTEQEDLQIKRVEFRPSTSRRKSSSTLLPHALESTGDVDGDGSFGYELTLTCPASLAPSRGTVVIETNHPDKQTLQVRCFVRE